MYLELIFPSDIPVAAERLARVVALETLQTEIAEQLRQINTASYNDLRKGVAVDGFTLQAGKKSRSITDESTAVKVLSEFIPEASLYDKKFLGLPAIEKALGKAGLKPEARAMVVKKFTSESVGNPIMVKI